jgi:hypothetical protein
LLYVSPEQLRNRSFREAIALREIGCWVFDEAHCLSKWGHDFRPDYLYAARFIREFAKDQGVEIPAIAGFTATAKRDVKEEILEHFQVETGRELALFEGGIAVKWWADRHRLLRLHHVREIHRFLAELEGWRGSMMRASQLLERFRGTAEAMPGRERASPRGANPWRAFLERTLEAWCCESDDAELPGIEAREFIHEACVESRGDFGWGEGVTLGTVHSAKGTEYDHVLLVGPWPMNAERAIQEEERRAFYVGMTRARKTLTVFDALEGGPSLAGELDGPAIARCRCEPSDAALEPDRVEFTLLGLEDIYLGYAGRFASHHRLHAALARLEPGDRLTLRATEPGVGLFDEQGVKLSTLSRKAEPDWDQRLSTVWEVRVVAMIQRRADQDEDAERRRGYRVEAWEVPLVEVVSNSL